MREQEQEQEQEQEVEVVIVGGGIAGMATALALERVGVRSLVLERSHELRTSGASITLFPNAWRALGALGVAHKLTAVYDVFNIAHVTKLESGATQMVTLNTTKDRDALGVRAVHRSALLEALAEELPPGTIRFSSKLASLESKVLQDSSVVSVLHLEDGAVIRAKVVIGCDGVHSVVAQWLGLTEPIDSGRSAVRGLSVFPEGHGFKGEVQEFLGAGRRAGFVPLNDKELFWFITYVSSSKEREIARDPELIQRHVIENLAKDFPPEYLEVVRHSNLATLTWAPLMFRRPWDLILGSVHKGTVTVAGDAMHPMTPDLGQGGCSALEDAVVLGRSIGSSMGNAAKGIELYVKERRWRVAGLIAGAYMSGWVQQGGSGMRGWAVRWFRDNIFYRFVFPMILSVVHYDCGVLPGYGLRV